MRLNKFLALYAGLSRRGADQAIIAGRVTIDGQLATLGQTLNDSSVVRLDGKTVTPQTSLVTVMLNKPRGYVVSHHGQGSQTIYDLLPTNFQHLQPVGRLDKNSSGLLLLTNDGQLAYALTHPKFQKTKIYEVKLDKPLSPNDYQTITGPGVMLEDGVSKLELKTLDDSRKKWQIKMVQGRNRQIRRTFAALNYEVKRLHRTQFGDYSLEQLTSGQSRLI